MNTPSLPSALLVIDVQDSFLVGPRWARRSSPEFRPRLEALIDGYRRAGAPIYYFLHSDGDEGFSTDHPAYRLMDFLAPRPEEPVLHKVTRNCFTSTPLLPLLLAQGVRRLVITGISMEQCCETTTRVAADLGFEVDFVTECTVTFPIADPDRPGVELGVDAIRERTEAVLRGRFARIRTADQVLSDLGGVQR